MEYDKKKKDELISLCKERKIKGYSNKRKDELIEILINFDKGVIISNIENINNKKNRGQFYTTNYSYILDSIPGPPSNVQLVIEPFAGKGDLINWIREGGYQGIVEAYDIEPKGENIIIRDTLKNPPNYDNSWIITNPPYLARNKSDNKEIYDLYKNNDLYKCFITSIILQNNCKGGIFIIPAGFFLSPRDVDAKCRHQFMSNYKITKVKYFEETVFDDTTTTVICFSFEKSDVVLTEQYIEWILMPKGVTKIFKMTASNNWIIGGEIYILPIPVNIFIRRFVENISLYENEQITYMTLKSLDSGSMDGRILLTYKKDYVYPGKESSRAYATLCVSGVYLSENDQIQLCEQFNKFIEEKRNETWSLFLPQYRESKEYARKRIPFELAYRIILHFIYLKTNF